MWGEACGEGEGCGGCDTTSVHPLGGCVPAFCTSPLPELFPRGPGLLWGLPSSASPLFLLCLCFYASGKALVPPCSCLLPASHGACKSAWAFWEGLGAGGDPNVRSVPRLPASPEPPKRSATAGQRQTQLKRQAALAPAHPTCRGDPSRPRPRPQSLTWLGLGATQRGVLGLGPRLSHSCLDGQWGPRATGPGAAAAAAL